MRTQTRTSDCAQPPPRKHSRKTRPSRERRAALDSLESLRIEPTDALRQNQLCRGVALLRTKARGDATLPAAERVNDGGCKTDCSPPCGKRTCTFARLFTQVTLTLPHLNSLCKHLGRSIWINFPVYCPIRVPLTASHLRHSTRKLGSRTTSMARVTPGKRCEGRNGPPIKARGIWRTTSADSAFHSRHE